MSTMDVKSPLSEKRANINLASNTGLPPKPEQPKFVVQKMTEINMGASN